MGRRDDRDERPGGQVAALPGDVLVLEDARAGDRGAASGGPPGWSGSRLMLSPKASKALARTRMVPSALTTLTMSKPNSRLIWTSFSNRKARSPAAAARTISGVLARYWMIFDRLSISSR